MAGARNALGMYKRVLWLMLKGARSANPSIVSPAVSPLALPLSLPCTRFLFLFFALDPPHNAQHGLGTVSRHPRRAGL